MEPSNADTITPSADPSGGTIKVFLADPWTGHVRDQVHRTLTFLGALRWDGITAPCIFDGPINGQCFRAYVEQLLLPALRQGDIVVLDNLGSHKAKALRPMLKAVGARLWYLPPYSPDLNPIEKAFSKIKHWMRLAQKRTQEGLSRYIANLLKTIRQSECSSYIQSAG